MWNDLDCSPKAAAYWRRSSPTVIRRGLLALCPKCNIASCLSLVVNEERQQGEEARQFRAGGRGIERDIDVRVFGRDAAVQPRKGVGEDADNLVPPLVGGHLLRIDWNRVPGHRARLWEVLRRSRRPLQQRQPRSTHRAQRGTIGSTAPLTAALRSAGLLRHRLARRRTQ